MKKDKQDEARKEDSRGDAKARRKMRKYTEQPDRRLTPDTGRSTPEGMLRYSMIFEEINDEGYPPGWYYAMVPTPNLTTHGETGRSPA
jgi:hypothetical protein